MLARLFLARHGETDWNAAHRVQGHTDIGLNATGRIQARALAQRARHLGIDAIETSDLARAAETAALVGEALGLEVLATEDWREIGLGALEGRGAEVVREHGELVSATARAGGPLADGAESYGDVERRVVRGLHRLEREHASETVLVVSHGGSLKVLLAHLLELAPERVDRLSLRGNCGLSLVDFRQGRPQVVLLGDTSHLEGLPRR